MKLRTIGRIPLACLTECRLNIHGTNCGTDYSENLAGSVSFDFTAAADSLSTFAGWSGGGCGGTGSCTVTINSDITITATFSRKFTDDPLTSKVTFLKAVHFLEPLEAINTVGQRIGLGTINFTAPIPAPGVLISAKDMITLQTGLNAIYDALGRTRPTFDSIVPRVTVVGKRQMDQVRNAIRAVETVPTQ